MVQHSPADVAQPLAVQIESDRGWMLVRLEGELDIATLPRVAQAVCGLREAGCTALRLDLRRLSFLDSAGLRYLLELSACRADGLRLSVVPGPRAVQRVVELTGTGDLIPFEPSGPAGPP